jgi:hypothetical protein
LGKCFYFEKNNTKSCKCQGQEIKTLNGYRLSINPKSRSLNPEKDERS